jgi:hypothetical protein
MPPLRLTFCESKFRFPPSVLICLLDEYILLKCNCSVAIPVNTRILADLFALDLLTQENPRGSLNTADLYTHLLNVRIWTFNNNDPAMAWRRRAWAAESTKVLTQTTKQTIQGIYRDVRTETLLGFFFSPRSARPDWSKKDSLRHYGRDVVKGLLASGKTVDEVVDISWMTALAGVGVCVSVVSLNAQNDIMV